MSAALFPNGVAALRRFCEGRVLLAFDFDGTLAPIVDDRDRARIPHRRRRRIRRLGMRVPVAVISGRSRADVAARLVGTGVGHVVGGHGLDDGTPDPAAVAVVAAIRRSIEGGRGPGGDRTRDRAIMSRLL